MNLVTKSFWVLLSSVLHFYTLCFSYPTPLNCTDTTRLCTSFLAFKPNSNETLSVIQSMFDVLPEDVTVEGNGRDYVFIRKNCSCASTTYKYLTNTTYTVRENGGSVHEMVIEAYDGLALLPNFSRAARAGAVVSLELFCGCSSGLWNYLMSYVMTDGDSIQSLASRFGVSMDSIETVNGIDNPDNATVGALYYIPLNSENVRWNIGAKTADKREACSWSGNHSEGTQPRRSGNQNRQGTPSLSITRSYGVSDSIPSVERSCTQDSSYRPFTSVDDVEIFSLWPIRESKECPGGAYMPQRSLESAGVTEAEPQSLL
ncbi:hypothetical protein TEA_010397 [Camellia sinensis var. sinensis]|uniref:LysM domain-containing protein n=1 Tax=Camellia sinensis var. sinensis TaxID=542762 RepID=A0A4S4DW03_CAMSN|nr:hypothetical protein TEA_010397 [Camellia sinensis var. sinensis]